MNHSFPSFWYQSLLRWAGALMGLYPSLLLAHPGHYHPDETDEFDFLRTTILHGHGAMDYMLAGIALASLAVAFLNLKPAVRISALAMSMVSLAVLPFV